jgi:hypothetical protein
LSKVDEHLKVFAVIRFLLCYIGFRAIQVKSGYLDAKIVLCRILLKLGNKVINDCNYGMKSRKVNRIVDQSVEAFDTSSVINVIKVSYNHILYG